MSFDFKLLGISSHKQAKLQLLVMIRYRTLRPHAISCHYLRSRSNRSSYISNSSCSWSPSSQPAEAGRDDSSELASAVDAAMKTALLYPSNSLPEKTTTPNGTHYGNELKALPALKPRRRKVSSKPKSQSDNTKTKTKTKPNPEPTTLKPQANLLDEILSIAAPTVFSIAKIRQLLRSRLKGLGTTALALVNQVQQAIDPVSDDGSGKTVDKPRRTQDDVSAARPKRNNRETSIFRRIEVAEEPLKTQDDTRPAKSVRNVASSSRSQRLKARRLIVARAKLKATITTTTTTPTTTLTLEADKMEMRGITTDHPPVKKLCYDLDRVLFKQGAYNLQDPRTGVFNFDHYLQHIMPAEEFDFDSLGAFVTSSKDKVLQDIAKKHRKSYVGSTSSMTSVLAQFHFLLSNFRPLNFARISSGFPNPSQTFTEFTRLPAAICLRYKDGVYALDADKSFDRGTILSQLGQSMEKLLLLPQEQYEQYRLSSPDKVPEEVKNTPEAYHYSTIGNFVFRSQLDGHHDWLPGTGIFDVKTRACVTIRMNAANYKEMSGYQIKGLYGEWESFEREYVDMLRSTMLKYSLQVRMGRMDGIFVAFHNTEQIFGFQYIPLSEMDLAIHGQENLALGDQEFKFSVQMFSDILDKVTEAYPNQVCLRYNLMSSQTDY